MSDQDACPVCGGSIIGDGFRTPLHCEYADEETYAHNEPDADLVVCIPTEEWDAFNTYY